MLHTMCVPRANTISRRCPPPQRYHLTRGVWPIHGGRTAALVRMGRVAPPRRVQKHGPRGRELPLPLPSRGVGGGGRLLTCAVGLCRTHTTGDGARAVALLAVCWGWRRGGASGGAWGRQSVQRGWVGSYAAPTSSTKRIVPQASQTSIRSAASAWCMAAGCARCVAARARLWRGGSASRLAPAAQRASSPVALDGRVRGSVGVWGSERVGVGS